MSLDVRYISAHRSDRSSVFLKCFLHQIEPIFDLLHEHTYQIKAITEDEFNGHEKACNESYVPGIITINFEYKDSVALLEKKLKIV